MTIVEIWSAAKTINWDLTGRTDQLNLGYPSKDDHNKDCHGCNVGYHGSMTHEEFVQFHPKFRAQIALILLVAGGG